VLKCYVLFQTIQTSEDGLTNQLHRFFFMNFHACSPMSLEHRVLTNVDVIFEALACLAPSQPRYC
jgi:hypothetical protein